MPEKIDRIAFFDFDDTICKGDSILPYLLYCIKRGCAPWTQLFRAAWGYLGWRMNLQKARRAKMLTLSFIKGRNAKEMDALGLDFLRQYVARRCFPEARAELERLRAQGYRVVVVTASADAYMRLLPEFLPVDDVIATRCPLDECGRYTGEVGENCKGDEKPRRIRAWLDEQGLTPDWPACRAYGDSPSDAPMLRMTGCPVLVDPKKKLAQRLPDAPRVRWHEHE